MDKDELSYNYKGVGFYMLLILSASFLYAYFMGGKQEMIVLGIGGVSLLGAITFLVRRTAKK